MSWLLKQAEDILNKVDQQTNAAFHQNPATVPKRQNDVDFIPESPVFIPQMPVNPPPVNRFPTNRTSTIPARRVKKTDETDLINYLNSSTPIVTNEIKQLNPPPSSRKKSRTTSSSSVHSDDSIPSPSRNKDNVPNTIVIDEKPNPNSDRELVTALNAQIQSLTRDKSQYENDLQTCRRQLIQYQHQIAESDALIRDLRSRESDSMEILATRDTQLALLRSRASEFEDLLRKKTSQYDELQTEYSRVLQDSSAIRSSSFEFLQSRKTQLEQELERNVKETERLNNENEQLVEQLKLKDKRLHDERLQLYEQQQQTKQAKNLANQLEQELNEYKAKGQRILQAKDKLITKLKDLIQQRSSTPSSSDQNELDNSGANDDTIFTDASLVGASPSSPHWASIQNEELKSENEFFKQELQTRELTIHKLRNELQEAELTMQDSEEQYQQQITQLTEQLKEEHSRLALAEQDYHRVKLELTSVNEDFHRQKHAYQAQLNERERDIERLRLQITAKTISHANDDELEKRLQTLTESLIHKQTIIETLQAEKSSLTMQLERLEKRLDDYETIATKNSYPQPSKSSLTTSISFDDNENYDNLRYRAPLLRETPYDVDLTKKVKRAANELDKLGIRFTILLRQYPVLRIGVLFYALMLHLWTLFILFTNTPQINSNANSINLKDKL